MKNKKVSYITIFLFLLFIILSVLAVAQEDISIGLQRIIEYNNKSTAEFAVQVSFLIAFVAGMLGILSPCILPFFPAYFSYTFKEKKNITKMTLIFFIGFSTVFVTMGAVAGFIGEQVLSAVQSDWMVVLAGIFIIILGLMAFFGKGFSSFFRLRHKPKNDVPGTLLLGMSFATGWTACLGPILAGILGIGAILGDIKYSALLLFFYSLGNLVPLFVLSIVYDRFNLSQSRFMQGKTFALSIAGKKYYLHSTNIISGLLLAAVGTIIVIYRGTAVVNTADIFGTKPYFYSIQRQLIGWKYADIFGAALLIAFIAYISVFLIKKSKRGYGGGNEKKETKK